ECFDVGLGFNPVWQPQITSVNTPAALGQTLSLTGGQFRGISTGSSGTGQDSSADYPLLQLRSIESGRTTFLLATDWSANSVNATALWNFPPGLALATLFVNGIQSTSAIVNISVPVPTPPVLSTPKVLANRSFQFSFTNSVGAVFGVTATTNV